MCFGWYSASRFCCWEPVLCLDFLSPSSGSALCSPSSMDSRPPPRPALPVLSGSFPPSHCSLHGFQPGVQPRLIPWWRCVAIETETATQDGYGKAGFRMYSVGMRSATFLSLPAIVLCASLSWSALESDAQSAAQAPAGAAPAAIVRTFPTSEELRHLKTMSAPLLSPDGRQVLFTVTEATADGGKTHFWLAAVDGKEKA